MSHTQNTTWRFNILTVVVLTAFAAVLMALDLHGIALSLFVFVVLPFAAWRLLVRVFHRVQLRTANRLAPVFDSRALFRLLPWLCGRKHAAWAFNSYAVQLFVAGNHLAARDAFDRILHLDDGCADYWAHRGASHFCLSEYDAAINDLTTALRLSKRHQLALSYRGFALMAKLAPEKAFQDLNQVHCHLTDHYFTAYCRGRVHEQLGQWQLAIDDYLLAYDLNSSVTEAGTALALLQAGCPDAAFRDADKAIENATKMCVRSRWQDWRAVSVLATGYAEAGNFETAIKYAKQALDLAPEEEKPNRQNRIHQYENKIPFRLPVPASSVERRASSVER
ncbi:tetratricopeptide repeat protein [Aporhodopirellula aestuarii]|uniref:Tetratricopeptide repeat protein n=1 Tax=Aporhodopirellula aestuarii TaxID=2950107 RepID=A0ABT0U7Q9_9BACT|nr:tetratricopeptide repeat protein [Aporhodopirellula aestuarii]MCM2372952.1 tetratricopeptide repeat protein [Aporhodopirellula aestuarii]